MKNKNIKISLAINIGLFLILLVSAIGFENHFYHMKEVNCKSIMGSDFGVSTGDVSECYEFYNFPFWNFYFIYYLTFGMIHLFMGLILNILLIETEMWDEDW